ncbi:hypothetical protein Q8A67_003369 [Cirrhinus molitorella]|uniref:Uncharacterized protein n=1 Tax=Cirrhinus molitorella TaxID=172907 RepID=A0AA88TW85_9TELE|nr:hypothetical protein Q8A67_003369 [Cirrhinus molitorella]
MHEEVVELIRKSVDTLFLLVADRATYEHLKARGIPITLQLLNIQRRTRGKIQEATMKDQPPHLLKPGQGGRAQTCHVPTRSSCAYLTATGNNFTRLFPPETTYACLFSTATKFTVQLEEAVPMEHRRFARSQARSLIAAGTWGSPAPLRAIRSRRPEEHSDDFAETLPVSVQQIGTLSLPLTERESEERAEKRVSGEVNDI